MEKNVGTEVYWCPACRVPLLQERCASCGSRGDYCASGIRPVFEAERKRYEKFTDVELPEILFRNRNRIIFDGKTLFRWKMNPQANSFESIESKEEIQSKLENYSSGWRRGFKRRVKECNEDWMREKEEKALRFIKEKSKEFNERFKAVSYSGGKDSGVVAILAKKALGDIPLFFSDTTLEFPETYEFVEEFASEYGFDLIKNEENEFYSSDSDFFDLCEELGPPSMEYRWCCTVFKAQPVNEFNKSLENGSLTFDGIRRSEGRSRGDYERVSKVKKIPKQIAAYPILDWSEAEVWFYTLFFEDIDYNPLYELGYTRVGCWVCPNASPSNTLLKKIKHPELWGEFEQVLEDYAEKHGKPDDWVTKHYWRLRRPKTEEDAENIGSSHKPCQSEEFYQYELEEPITPGVLEHFKPFGELTVQDRGEETSYFRIESGNSFDLSGIDSKINVRFKAENPSDEKELFGRYLERALNCINCGGCIGACPQGAISITDGKFTIDSEKCTRCGKCLESDCMALKFKRDKVSLA